MRQLLYKIDYDIEHCFIGFSFRTLTIRGRVYGRQIKFLWWKKTFYTYTLNVPYIKNPYYDGEYATNKILRSCASMIKQGLRDKIFEFKHGKPLIIENYHDGKRVFQGLGESD